MINILLVHCYTDYNKGDAAIIISTIQRLKALYPGCRVNLQSTYSSDDQNFHTQHLELSKYVENIYTCLFPQLFLKRGEEYLYDTKSKQYSLIKFSLRNLVNYFSVRLFKRLLISTTEERASLQAMKDADLIISKGGSFLCSHGNLREDISLFRLMHPFLVAKALKKKVIVLGQSLGPFDSKLSKFIFNVLKNNVDRYYIRERRTLELLDSCGISIEKNRLGFCPDVAFYFDSSRGQLLVDKSANEILVGITIVDFAFDSIDKKNNYIESIRLVVNTYSQHEGIRFVVFPQVIDTHPEFGTADIRLAREIVQGLERKDKITILDGNYESIDLANTYKKMDVFIATRLHSSIFAMASSVPALNISYHGTKSEGTFEVLGLQSLVVRITEIKPEEFLERFNYVFQNRDSIRASISEKMVTVKSDIDSAFKSIFDSY